jgi:gliding motility-associated-like protein
LISTSWNHRYSYKTVCDLVIKKILIGCLLIFFFGKVNGQLVAEFSADVLSGCAPIRVVFTDNSTGGVTDWKWDLGNGTIAEHTSNPSTTYLLPGTYTVKLTVYKDLTDSAQVIKTNYITIFATPIVNFGGIPLVGCLPLKVQFKDSSIIGGVGVPSFQWDFGDGNIAAGQNPVHIYNSPGNFKVTLIIKNGSGCSSSDSRLNYVTAFDSVSARFGFKAPTLCSLPATYTFTDSSIGPGIIKWSWDFGDGGTSFLKSPTHVYTTKGPFTVRLIVQNINGCADTVLKVNAISPGNFTAAFTLPASECLGKTVAFTNTSVPLNQVDSSRWDFGDGKSSTGLDASHAYFTSGIFNVKLISWFGSCSDSVTQPVNILPGPIAKFTASPTSACKPPLSVQFNNLTVGGTVVKWILGNGATSTLDNPLIKYNSYGSFDVSLIVKSASGCLDTLVQKDLVVIDKPKITAISGLPYSGCLPWTNTFSAIVNASVATYQWDFGDGTTSGIKNPTHTFTDTTAYNVKLIITTVDGCSDTVTNTVHGGLKPKTNFVGTPNWICPLDPVKFTNLSSVFANSWFWQFGDGGTSVERDPTYLYMDTGYKTVTLISYNNGCADTLAFPDYVYINPPIARFNDSSNCSNKYKMFFTNTSIGGKYFKWYIGNFDSVESRDLEYTFPDTGYFEVKLYARDSLCEHQSTHIIRIIDEKAAFITSDSGTCGNSYKRFIVTGPNTHPENIVKYKWDFGDGKISITDTPIVVHTYAKSGTVNVRLIVTDINGCTDTSITPLPIKLFGPKANFGPAINNICAGNTITFTDSTLIDPANPVVKWQWNFGNGADTIFTSPPFQRKYTDAGAYDVKLIVTDALGCVDSLLRKRAVIVYKPIADFVSPDTLICLNSPTAFTNLSTGVLIKSDWSFGDGKTSTVDNPSTIYSSLGQYDVQLIISDSLNCRDTLIRPKYISVENTVAGFSVSDSFTTCPPLVVNFNNESSNNTLNQWTFGNGNSSSLVSPSHTYTLSGSFTAKLVVTGHGGCTDSVSKQINIKGPLGTLSYGPLGGCPPLVVNFVTNAINTKLITYDFSDGQSTLSTDTLASHTYAIPGTFVPRAILSDGLGCKLPIQGLDTIHVLGAKAYIQSLPVYDFCDSTIVNFFDSTITLDVVKSYAWDFGDGTGTNIQNPTHSYTKPGNYIITFEVKTSSGCISKDTIDQPVIIAKTPQLAIGHDSPVCVPASVQYRAFWLNSDTSQLSWKWSFGNGQSSDLFKPDPIFYDKPASYPVSLTASNRYGCADTVKKLVIVNDTPNVVVGPPAHLCFGNTLQLVATGGVKFQWDNNSSLSCLTCKDPVASPSSNQIYRAVVTDTNGCKSSDTVLVKVKLPAALSAGPGDTLCVGQSIQLQASGTERYSWSPSTGLSSTTIPNPVARPITTTSYMVVGFDSLNCFTDTGYIDVVVYPIPTFNIIEDKITALTGSLINIATTSSADITRWHWTPPSGLSCTNCAEPVVTIGIPVTYTAVVSNPGNCRAEDRVTIIPLCNKDNVFIPNTFSPNGDGQNDIFYPRGKGLSLVKSMRIFSRWGELLFEQKDFAFNDPGAGWDGTFKQAKLTPDVYVYMIDVLCDNNVTFNLKGNVTLLR